MPDYLDDFVCRTTIEEYEQSYISHEMWEEAERSFCEEFGIEAECYED